MKFTKNFTVLAIVLALMVPAAAAPKSGKVRMVIGDVTYQKSGKQKWLPLRVDGRVKEKDRIKTETESIVSIAFPDGSVVSVAERSEVEFSELVFLNGSQITTIDIKEGQLHFDVQKQNIANKSSFKFKTGTAIASIRGTDGVIGVSKGGQVIGSLGSGAMDMEQDGVKVSVKPNQFVAFRKGKKPIVGEAKNAGDSEFMKKIAEMVDDTTKSDSEIMSLAKTLDDQMETSKANLMSKYTCAFDPMPEVVDTNFVSISATCTAGMSVTIGAETMVSTGEKMVFTPGWTEGAMGVKKFLVTCSAEKQSFECGRLSTKYEIFRRASFTENDVNECEVGFVTHGFEDHKGTLTLLKGDSIMWKTVVSRDTSGKLYTIPGEFVYTLVAENDDPKVGKVMEKLKCAPKSKVAIEVAGGEKEVVKKKISQGTFAYPQLEFVVKNVFDDDKSQVKSVKVRIDDKTFDVKQFSVKDGIGYKSTVRVPRGKVSIVNIVVTLLDDTVVSAQKTYEFK